MQTQRRKTYFWISVLVISVVLALFLFSLLGKPHIALINIFSNSDSQEHFIFWQLRLSRFVLAFVIGAALSVSGASFQSLLKNPLADPYILGVSGGAALGYVLAVVAGVPFILVPILGFVCAFLSLLLVYTLACRNGVLSVVSLLLVGIVFNAFSFALILVVNAVANFGQAQQILYLLLGNLDPISWTRLLVLSSFLVLSLVVLLLKSKQLNLLSLGDEEAFHLGVNVNREKKIIFVVTSLLVGASVSLCGLIGFVGLIVPHLCRLLFGADNRRVLPASVFLGGLLLMVCEFVAGNMLAFDTLNTRVPVGAVTALIGAPFFVFMLRRMQNKM